MIEHRPQGTTVKNASAAGGANVFRVFNINTFVFSSASIENLAFAPPAQRWAEDSECEDYYRIVCSPVRRSEVYGKRKNVGLLSSIEIENVRGGNEGLESDPGSSAPLYVRVGLNPALSVERTGIPSIALLRIYLSKPESVKYNSGDLNRGNLG